MNNELSSALISSARRKIIDPALSSIITAGGPRQHHNDRVGSDAAAAMCRLISHAPLSSSSSNRISRNTNQPVLPLSSHFSAPWEAALFLLDRSRVADVGRWIPNVLACLSNNLEQRVLAEEHCGSSSSNVQSSLWTSSLKLVAALRSQEIFEVYPSASSLALAFHSQQQKEQLRREGQRSCKLTPAPWVSALQVFSRQLQTQGESAFTQSVYLVERMVLREIARSCTTVDATAELFEHEFLTRMARTATSVSLRRIVDPAGAKFIAVVDSNVLRAILLTHIEQYHNNDDSVPIADDEKQRAVQNVAAVENFFGGKGKKQAVIFVVPAQVQNEVLGWMRRDICLSDASSARLLEECLRGLFSGRSCFQHGDSSAAMWIALDVQDAIAASVYVTVTWRHNSRSGSNRSGVAASPPAAAPAASVLYNRWKHASPAAGDRMAATAIADLAIAQQYLYVKQRAGAKKHTVLLTFDRELARLVRGAGGDVPKL